jgi:Condensation domain
MIPSPSGLSSDEAGVGKHAAHYLDVVEKYKNDPQRSYHFHHLMVNFQILGPFDSEKFKAAVMSLARIHPAFRTTFRKENNCWIQSVMEEPDPRIFEHLKFNTEIDDWRGHTRDLIYAENEQPFDITGEPLIKFVLLEYQGISAFMTKFHHIICDGWGILVALSQLLGLYESQLKGILSPAEAMPASEFLATATREASWLESAEGAKALGWWQTYLGGHAFLRNPLAERPQGRLALCTDHLSLKTSAQIYSLAERAGVHFSYLVHAAFVKALKTWTSSDDILVTFVKANRNDANTAVVGNFADWVTVRHRLDLKARLELIAKNAQRDVAEAKEHYLPYWHIVKELCPQQYFNDFGITPYSFDYMPELNPNIDHGGQSSFTLLRDLEVFPFRLTATDIFCRTTLVGQLGAPERRIEVFLIYHGGFLSAEKVQGMLAEMKGELERAAQDQVIVG